MVVAYVLIAVGRIHQLVPALDSLRPALVTGALAMALYFMSQAGIRRVEWTWTTPAKCVVALFVWMTLCVPSALVPSESLIFVLQNFSKTAVMVFVIAGCVRGTRDVERLAGAYVTGAALYSVIAMRQYNFAESWRLGELFYYDANDLATFLVTAVPFGLYFLHKGRRTSTRALCALALLLIAVAFVRTGSRGGFLALGAVVVYVLLRYSAIPLRIRAGATALVAVTVLVAAGDQYWSQMRTIFQEDDYNRTEETGRLQIWSRGIGYMVGNPLLGVGPDAFETAEGTLSPVASRQNQGFGVKWNAAHNAYVQAGAELGFPGLAIFVALLVTTFRMLRRYRQRAITQQLATARPELSQALTASLLGFVVGAFFLSLAYHEMLYVLVAFAIGLAKTAPRTGWTRPAGAVDVAS
jgi:O-antigen ligase